MFSHRIEALFLFLGDVILLYVALFLTLFIRYGLPFDQFVIRLHFLPFSLLFVLWITVFFIAGLYERHTLLFQRRLPQLLLSTLSMNGLIAVLLFYFIPSFLITPRANLFIYLAISFIVIFLWRKYGSHILGAGEKQRAIIVGNGAEFHDLIREINDNPRYNLRFISSLDSGKLDGIDFQEDVLQRVFDEDVSLMVIDLTDRKVEPLMPHLYNLLFSRIRFMNLHKLYEEIFGRIPLSLVRYSWFLGNISTSSRLLYDFGKRTADILFASLLGAISLFIYPLVYLGIKLDDKGAIFVFQERIGQHNKIIKTIKFRTMSRDDAGNPELKQGNNVTRFGAFLRRTRIDELPQLWNVMLGEMSLIGPRPELPSLVKLYEKEIPYYHIRHLLKPGLSGWAQIYHKTPPKVDANSNETAIKLSYDLFYLKNRSFFLDFKIALKTLKVLLSRSGV